MSWLAQGTDRGYLISDKRGKDPAWWEKKVRETVEKLKESSLTPNPEFEAFGPVFIPDYHDTCLFPGKGGVGIGVGSSFRYSPKENPALYHRLMMIQSYRRHLGKLLDIYRGGFLTCLNLEPPADALRNHRWHVEIHVNGNIYQVFARYSEISGYSWEVMWPDSFNPDFVLSF